jgi:phage/plasmid-like protein (TIGR03299 family)
MAHHIESNDYMASGNGIRPWHGLGSIVEGMMTAQDALREARLGWTARKHPITLAGTDRIIPDQYAVTRDDDNSVLGIVGSSYEILQNADAFNFFDTIAERGDAIYETAGSLFGGRRIFITAKIPGLIQVGSGEDVTEKYILLSNSHDGTSAVSAKLVMTRVVCNNTLTAAMRESGRSISIRHSQLMHEKIRMATEMLGVANKRFIEMEQSFNEMLKVKMTEQDVKKYLMSVFDIQEPKTEDDRKSKDARAVIQCLELHETGKGSEMTRGTLWGAMNAVTEWTSHHRTYKERAGGNTRVDNKGNSILFGNSSALTERAVAMATKRIARV